MLPDDLRTAIATLIRTGMVARRQVAAAFSRDLPSGTTRKEVAAEVDAQFAAYAAEQAEYPATTDCDRLDAAFAALNGRGVIAMQNAGFDQSEGVEEVGEAYNALSDPDRNAVIGYCFYHGQDLERVVGGGGLNLAFGPVDPAEEQTVGVRVGEAVREELERAGLTVEWDGTFKTRLCVPDFNWQKRS